MNRWHKASGNTCEKSITHLGNCYKAPNDLQGKHCTNQPRGAGALHTAVQAWDGAGGSPAITASPPSIIGHAQQSAIALEECRKASGGNFEGLEV